MSSDVRYIYTNNISNINQIEQGSFVYNINDQRLYLCTPEGAGESKLLAAVGRSIIYINSLEDIETYQNNEIYLTQDGKLYYYHRDVNTNPQEIASVKVLQDLQKEYKAADEALQRQIGYRTYTDGEGATVPAIGLNKDIEDINKTIGEAGGTAGREATGLYKIIFDLDAAQKSLIQELDNKKVDTKTFEDTLKNYSTTEDLNTDLENNYYTKTQAKDLFLSANEELFLTEGSFIANCEYAEVNDRYVLWNEDLSDVEKLVGPCIVLTIKNNSTATDQEELQINTIVIPAIDLVDIYKGSSATNDSNIDVNVSNYIVSANVNVDNLIGSADNDTVKLSNNGTNKIIALFKTENIVDSTTAGKNVSLSVGEDNKISAQIEIDNLIKNTSGSLVTLEKNEDGKTMSVLLDSSVSNAIKRIGDINDIEDSVETLTETLSQYGITNLEENETEYELKDGLITQAIKVEANKIAKLNEDFIEYKDNHETEFNTYKQAFENYKTTNNTNITKIGSYQYNAKTENVDASVTVIENTYFAEVKDHINAETTDIKESLNNTKANLDKEISDLKAKDSNIDISISTLESWVGSIYQVKDENGNNLEKPTGILAQEITNREQSDINLNNKIKDEEIARIAADENLQDNIDTFAGDIGSYIFVPAKPEDETPAIEAHYEADGYFGVVNAHLEEEVVKLNTKDAQLEQLIETINTTTIPGVEETIEDLAGDDNTSTVAANASAISELQNKINNADTGLAKAHSKIDNLTAAANRAYVEKEDTAVNGDKSYSLNGGYIKDYIDTKASKLEQDITGLSTGAIKTNADNIKNLQDNFNEAISLTKATDSEEYSLIGGAVKEYVDALAGANNTSTVAANAQAISNLDTAYKAADKALTITTIECGLYKLNDSNKPDATNGIDKHSLKITFENNTTAYYPLGDYIKDNYYTKTEANSAFLGADKDLFLTSGEVLKGLYDTNTKTFTENNDGTWHIILTLRDVNADDNNPGEQIVIPADSLVTYYTANNTNKPVTITFNGFTISADLTADVKNQLNQVELTKIDNATPAWDSVLTGTTLADKVNSLPLHVSTNYATKASIDDLFKANTVGTTTTYTGSIGELINGINSNIDNIETALSDEGDTGKAIKANTEDIAGIGEYIFNDQTRAYTAIPDTSFGNVNKHITEVIGSVNALSDSIGVYSYTEPSSNNEVLGTAAGSTQRFINVQNHINDLKAYVDKQDEALGDRIEADEKALTDYKTEVGTISLTDATYSLSNSGYIKLLNDKLSGEIDELETGAVADNTKSIQEINTLLNAYGLAPKDTENNYVLGESGIITAAIADNTTAIATNATNIATNVTAIATNATNIATNATEIGINAAAIAAKMNLTNPFGTGKFSMNVSSTDDNSLGTNSTTLGSSSLAKGTNSFASGQGVIVNGSNEHVVGQYNLQTSDYAYVIKTTSGRTMDIGNFDSSGAGSAGTLYYFDGVNFNLETGRIEQSSVYAVQATSTSLNARGSYFYTGGNVQEKIYKITKTSPNRASYSNGTNVVQYTRSWRITYDIYELVPAEQMGYIVADTAFAVGNGTSDTNRSNAFTILKNGEAHFTNTVYIDEANQEIPLFKSSGGEIFGNVTITNTTGAVQNDTTTTGALIVNGGVVVKEKVIANKVYGSVWNDYAEYRQTHHKVRPGQCVYEKGDGSLAISYERMMPGANIVSDTFGFAIGETDECKTPLAVSGRVLAYPYESKEEYKPGDAVCSGPNGTISKMTRAEIRDYPERIVGTVSEIPTYEVWGSGNIKVNGRIWIKVR